MRSLMTKSLITFAMLTLGFASVPAQDSAAVTTPHSESASGLDLYAVAELFKTSDNLESFEQSLNHADTGINNLDLIETARLILFA